MMDMMDKFKMIVSFEKCDNDNFNVVYDNNMTKKISLNKYDNKDFLINFEKELIEKFSIITPLYEKENTTLISLLEDTFEMIGNKTKTLEKFIIINNKVIDVLNGFNVFKTSYIKEDEIIFGYRTDSNEPGITIFYNEDTLDDDEIRLTISEIGYFPSASYRRFTI
jgi:hypothetical protein